MSDEERGNELFKEAIESLQDGLWDDAGDLFKQVIDVRGMFHHQSILALKSLVTISSNKGDLQSSLDWSLQLLEAQGETLGYSHADTSRTVENICTMCVTLGKKEIAEEVRMLARDASNKERLHRSKQVKDLRSKDPLPEPEEEEEEERKKQSSSFGHILIMMIDSFKDVGALVAISFTLIILTSIAAPLIFLKLTFENESTPAIFLKNREYASIDGATRLGFRENNQISIVQRKSQLELPVIYSGRSWQEAGELLLSSPGEKEILLAPTSQGLLDSSGQTFFRTNAAEFRIIKQQKKVARQAEKFFESHAKYPESTEELESAPYENPFTLRKDYPVVQKIIIPSQIDPQSYIHSLLQGARWSGEPVFYPGSINCGYIATELNSAAQETFIIHACDGRGNLFRDHKGKPVVLALQKGKRIDNLETTIEHLENSNSVRVITSEGMSKKELLLLYKHRHSIFYGAIAFILLILTLRFNNLKARVFTLLLFLASAAMAVVSAIL